MEYRSTSCCSVGCAMLDLPLPLAVVAHDAGAANLILGWLDTLPAGQLRPVMRGPAAALWHRRFPDIAMLPSIDAALYGARALLTGTGWASDFEHDARCAAAAHGLPSTAAIDHWVNYAARFERNGTTMLPDEILVGDAFALDIARRTFPELPVRLLDNRYLAEQVARIVPAEKIADPDILYVLEPIRDDWGCGTPGEFQALDYFLSHRTALGLPETLRLRLRPHPSDPPRKYDAWIASHGSLKIVLDTSDDLSEALNRAGWVVGCHSFALVVALAAGRVAISSLPPWAPSCALPHDGLIHLKAVSDQ